jgi:hypothetical protein
MDRKIVAQRDRSYLIENVFRSAGSGDRADRDIGVGQQRMYLLRDFDRDLL